MNIWRTGLVLIGSVALSVGLLGQAVQAATVPSPEHFDLPCLHL